MRRCPRPLALPRDDRALSVVAGAVILLAILSVTLLYINAYRVPLEGEARDKAFVDEGTRAMEALQVQLRPGSDDRPVPLLRAQLPLTQARAEPGLLAGILLTPASAAATVTLDVAGPVVEVYAVTADNETVHHLGAPGAGVPLGNLTLAIDPAYGPRQVRLLEGGALLAGDAAGDWAPLSGPGLVLAPDRAVLRFLKLTGETTSVTGGPTATLSLEHQGTTGGAGDAIARRLVVILDTPHGAPWRTFLTSGLGASVPDCADPPTSNTTCIAVEPTRVVLAIVGGTPSAPADLAFRVELAVYRATLQ